MNIAFSICYFNVIHKIIFGETSSITVFEKFSQYWEQKLRILLTSCSNRLCMPNNRDTILETHRRLDKTVYGYIYIYVVSVSSGYFFEFFMLLGLVISSSEGASYKNL